jgi:hypothetical protein
MEKYVYTIDVKCVAPENYRPRTSTYKGVAFSMHRNIGDKLKEKAISIVKKSISEQNPGVPLKFSATISIRTNKFCIDIDDDLAGIEKVRIPLGLN